MAYIVMMERSLNFDLTFRRRRIHHYHVGLLSLVLAALLNIISLISGVESSTIWLGWRRTSIPEILQGLSFTFILGGITFVLLDARDLASTLVNCFRKIMKKLSWKLKRNLLAKSANLIKRDSDFQIFIIFFSITMIFYVLDLTYDLKISYLKFHQIPEMFALSILGGLAKKYGVSFARTCFLYFLSVFIVPTSLGSTHILSYIFAGLLGLPVLIGWQIFKIIGQK